MTMNLDRPSRPYPQNRVMITGATGGLGKAFAVECASRGWNLFLTDLTLEPLETLAEGIRRAYAVNVAVSGPAT